ncbi:MAG TPA: RHS repeat-associated core domain-containing protein [Nitrososphaeraceae archaeon]|nr:RHS repeat-associated core domain-containing protein [Nitrososphaeraceae archaeon]
MVQYRLPMIIPFGEIISSYVSNGSDKYKFTQKERDTETNLDYFGARYYDSEIGRWLSPDPLADKYPGWSPYNYCLNNPVNLVDPDGRDVIVLLASKGASGLGHAAVLIGNEEKGWWYLSKNGTIGGIKRIFGPPDFKPEKFLNLQEFKNVILNDMTNPYNFAYRIKSDEKTDEMMIDAGKKSGEQFYILLGNNCMDLVDEVLKAGGFKTSPLLKKVSSPGVTGVWMTVPNERYQSMQKKNKGKDFSSMFYHAKDKSENGDRFNDEN